MEYDFPVPFLWRTQDLYTSSPSCHICSKATHRADREQEMVPYGGRFLESGEFRSIYGSHRSALRARQATCQISPPRLKVGPERKFQRTNVGFFNTTISTVLSVL